MAYSAYCDTASATKWWITGTGSAVNRLSEVMDDNASGVEEADNPGNYQPWATFMTEHVEDGLYQIHLPFEIGNNSTTTTLESFDEFVYFDDVCKVPLVNGTGATLNMGKLGGGNSPQRGAAWRFASEDAGDLFATTNSTITIYSSMIMCLPDATGDGFRFYLGSPTLEHVIISQEGANQYLDVHFVSTNLSAKHVYIGDGRIPVLFKTFEPATTIDVVGGDGGLAPVGMQTISSMTVENSDWYDSGSSGFVNVWNSGAMTVYLKDPVQSTGGSITLANNASVILYEQYTCNVHVVDRNGDALQSVVVDCEDTTETAVWAVGSIATDASGDIAEQTISYKKWAGTSETLTDYSPHKFTITKPGYETLVLDSVTVDAKIVWHLEMQPLRAKVYGRSHRIQASQFQ